MASNESMVGREHKRLDAESRSVILSPDEYNILKAKADLYDEYIKQSRFYNKTVANKNHEDDGK